jgi:hypothetical protein
MRGFNEKLFGDKLVAGQLPTQLGIIGSQEVADFLLDAYPNASAAYSLRKLRGAYAGSAIRVRRSSDNAEQNIGFVNNFLDTATLTSFCSGTNGFVKTWFDQSGNGLNFDSTSAGSQPQIIFSGIFNNYLQTQVGMSGTYEFKNNNSYSYFAAFQNFGDCLIMGNLNVFKGVGQNGGASSSCTTQFTNYSNFKNGVSFGNTRDNFFDNTVSFGLITIKATFVNVVNTPIFLGDSAFGLNANRFKELVIYDNQTVSQVGVENNIESYYGF